VAQLDLTKLAALTFEKPDVTNFNCLTLAQNAIKTGGTACAVLCGANDAAVELFLRGKLSFNGIADSVAAALDNIGNNDNPSVGELIEYGDAAYEFVLNQTTGGITKCT